MRLPVSQKAQGTSKNSRTALLRTCRLFRREATPMLYKTVGIHPVDSLSLHQLEARIGAADFGRIETLMINYLTCISSKHDLASLKGLKHFVLATGPVQLGNCGGQDLSIARNIRAAPSRQAVRKALLIRAANLWSGVGGFQIARRADRRYTVSSLIVVRAVDTRESFEVCRSGLRDLVLTTAGLVRSGQSEGHPVQTSITLVIDALQAGSSTADVYPVISRPIELVIR